MKLDNQKEIIFNTAKEIILSKDIQKFSMRMVSKKCNLSIGTIYKYYGNKNDILIDVTKDFWVSYITFIKNNVNQSSDFLERIKFYYDALVTFSTKFNYLILSKELSASFKKVGKTHHDKAQKIFTEIVANDVSGTLNVSEHKAEILANFICNNLVSLITIETYEFETFNYILQMLLSTIKGEKNELL